MKIKYTKRVVTETKCEVDLEELLGQHIYLCSGDEHTTGFLIKDRESGDPVMLWDKHPGGVLECLDPEGGVSYYKSNRYGQYVSKLDEALLSVLRLMDGHFTLRSFAHVPKAVKDYILRKPYTEQEVIELEKLRSSSFRIIMSLADPMIEIYYKRNATTVSSKGLTYDN